MFFTTLIAKLLPAKTTLPEKDKTPVQPASFNVGRDLRYTLIADDRIVGTLGLITGIDREFRNSGGYIGGEFLNSGGYLVTLSFTRQGGTEATLSKLLAAKHIGFSEVWRNPDQSVDEISYIQGRVVSASLGGAYGTEPVYGSLVLEFGRRSVLASSV